MLHQVVLESGILNWSVSACVWSHNVGTWITLGHGPTGDGLQMRPLEMRVR